MGMFGTEFHLQKLTLLTRPGQLFGKKTPSLHGPRANPKGNELYNIIPNHPMAETSGANF